MFEQEMETGCLAVVEAMRITRLIQRDLTGKDSITKSDKSPVTIADYTSQAIICKMLKTRFPGIPIVGEEHSDALKKAEHTEILNKIFHYIENDEKTARWLNRDNLCECIDLGGDEPTDGVFWTLDPVDGTKGFLRGEQFAIALALIVNGEVRLGILGCPNLDIPGHPARFGWLIRSVKGEGSFLENPETGEIIKCHISDITDPRHMRFVESYVSAHSDKIRH